MAMSAKQRTVRIVGRSANSPDLPSEICYIGSHADIGRTSWVSKVHNANAIMPKPGFPWQRCELKGLPCSKAHERKLDPLSLVPFSRKEDSRLSGVES